QHRRGAHGRDGGAARRDPPHLGGGRDPARAAADGDGPQVPGGHEDRGHRLGHGQDPGRREAADPSGSDAGPLRGREGGFVNVPRDLELDQLFDDAELLRTAYYLKAVRTPEPPVDPAFRMALRRELMQRAWTMSERKRPWWRVLLGPPALAWAGAAAAAVVVALVATLFYAGPINPGEPVRVQSDLDNATNVGLVQPIPVAFDQPMDHPS